MSVRAASVALVSLFVFGCGGGKPAKEPSADSEDAGTPPEESTPPPAPPKEEPPAEEPVGCKVLSTCTQVMASGAGVAAAKEKCVAAKGEAVDGGCSKDDLLATCELPSNGALIYTYAVKNPQKNRGLLKGAGDACKKAEGTFTPAERPKGDGGKKGGGGKKKKK